MCFYFLRSGNFCCGSGFRAAFPAQTRTAIIFNEMLKTGSVNKFSGCFTLLG